jgi:hypothetical protein
MRESLLASMSNLMSFGWDTSENHFTDDSGRLLGLSWWIWPIAGYGVVELLFAIVVYKVWLPRLNKPKDHPIIRNFEDPTLRHKLFERMLRRQESLCDALDVDKKNYFTEFIRNWFFYGGEHPEEVSGEDTTQAMACIKETGLPCKADIDKLISWGYFQVHADDLTEAWQQRELDKMYAMIKEKYDMGPGPKSKQRLIPVNMTIDDIDIQYRPVAIYMGAFLARGLMALFLYSIGFKHYVATSGLPYWYRPAKRKSGESNKAQPLPFLFFHGIAPCGATFYMPMILGGMARDEDGNIDRPIFLFRNPAVAFGLTDHAPTEQETNEGVWEAVDKHLGPTAEVCTVGHSFGTCLQTYLIHSSQSHRVRQMVLIDPVSICLSDPDVITNFVYGRSHHRGNKLSDSVPSPGAAGFVMNELFIEHFLRRQFAWYNGELFLEDIPDHCKIIVCLSDRDEILNAQKVKAHIDIYNGNSPKLPKCMKHLKEKESKSPDSVMARVTNPSVTKGGSTLSSVSSSASLAGSLVESAGRQKLDVIYWEGEGMGHGCCLFFPSTWHQVRRMMYKQQLQIIKEKSL